MSSEVKAQDLGELPFQAWLGIFSALAITGLAGYLTADGEKADLAGKIFGTFGISVVVWVVLRFCAIPRLKLFSGAAPWRAAVAGLLLPVFFGGIFFFADLRARLSPPPAGREAETSGPRPDPPAAVEPEGRPPVAAGSPVHPEVRVSSPRREPIGAVLLEGPREIVRALAPPPPSPPPPPAGATWVLIGRVLDDPNGDDLRVELSTLSGVDSVAELERRKGAPLNASGPNLQTRVCPAGVTPATGRCPLESTPRSGRLGEVVVHRGTVWARLDP